jgi:hypothetical protein
MRLSVPFWRTDFRLDPLVKSSLHWLDACDKPRLPALVFSGYFAGVL